MNRTRVFIVEDQGMFRSFLEQWLAEQDRFVAAGARYFVAQAVHHDNFFDYESSVNPWNSVKIGPGKDIVGLWKAAADERGLPFGMDGGEQGQRRAWAVRRRAVRRDRSGLPGFLSRQQSIPARTGRRGSGPVVLQRS